MSERDQFELFLYSKNLQPVKQEIFTMSSVNNSSFVVSAPQNNGTNLINGFKKHKPKSEKNEEITKKPKKKVVHLSFCRIGKKLWFVAFDGRSK